MNVEIIDKFGDQILCTFFNDSVSKYKEFLKVGGCYLFYNGQIKSANKKYTSIKNDYQISFNKETEIKEIEEDDNIKAPEEVFAFSTLKEIKSLPNDSRVDFIGVVLTVGDLDEISLKSGRVKPVR